MQRPRLCPGAAERRPLILQGSKGRGQRIRIDRHCLGGRARGPGHAHAAGRWVGMVPLPDKGWDGSASIDTAWVAEHGSQVARMLPGGGCVCHLRLHDRPGRSSVRSGGYRLLRSLSFPHGKESVKEGGQGRLASPHRLLFLTLIRLEHAGCLPVRPCCVCLPLRPCRVPALLFHLQVSASWAPSSAAPMHPCGVNTHTHTLFAGLCILGAFIFCPESAYKSAAEQLCSVLRDLVRSRGRQQAPLG